MTYEPPVNVRASERTTIPGFVPGIDWPFLLAITNKILGMKTDGTTELTSIERSSRRMQLRYYLHTLGVYLNDTSRTAAFDLLVIYDVTHQNAHWTPEMESGLKQIQATALDVLYEVQAGPVSWYQDELGYAIISQRGQVLVQAFGNVPERTIQPIRFSQEEDADGFVYSWDSEPAIINLRRSINTPWIFWS